MTNRTKLALSARCLPVALALGLALRWARPWAFADDHTVPLCRERGLAAVEIEGLIETTRGSPATREVKLGEFYATFPNWADAEPREPCAEAVLDAAGR